jgi:multidrug efflux pump subunit AcrA (membrane-fusion protein)
MLLLLTKSYTPRGEEKRAVPQQDLDNALASVDVGQAAVFSAKARVQAAELDLSYCTVTAPTNGLIGAKQDQVLDRSMPAVLLAHSTTTRQRKGFPEIFLRANR